MATTLFLFLSRQNSSTQQQQQQQWRRHNHLAYLRSTSRSDSFNQKLFELCVVDRATDVNKRTSKKELFSNTAAPAETVLYCDAGDDAIMTSLSAGSTALLASIDACGKESEMRNSWTAHVRMAMEDERQTRNIIGKMRECHRSSAIQLSP